MNKTIRNIPPSRIAFDFDGVVADTFRLFIQIAKSDYAVDIDYEMITSYEFIDVVNMNFEHATKIIDALTFYPHELDLKPNKGAADVLARIARTTRLLFVTARPVSEPVEMWFEKFMPQIHPDSIEVLATGENTSKLPALKKQEITYFIDDRLDTCNLLAAQGITPIVYDQPWNR
ncbi:MAG TPA: haloacid dehalogenase, partial [Deltaproteobacteria bacterium]|nr:haloacid dehalogenase [Deltaproteobacteria bacterium]